MFSSNIVIGTILILFGLSLWMKTLFGITFPIIRLFIGGLLMYAGINVLTNLSFLDVNFKKMDPESSIVFEKRTIQAEKLKDDYKVMFSDGVIDLTKIQIPTEPIQIELNNIFSKSKIILNPEIPTKIDVKASFSTVHFPNDTQISFGKYSYTNEPNANEYLLNIKANVVFSSLDTKNL